MPLDLNQPVVKLNTPSIAAGAAAWTMEMPHNINLGCLLQQVKIVKPHASTNGQPAALSDVIDQFCWKGRPGRKAGARIETNTVEEDNLAAVRPYFRDTEAMPNLRKGELMA